MTHPEDRYSNFAGLLRNDFVFPGQLMIVDPKLQTVNYSGYEPGGTTMTTLISHLNGFTIIKTAD